MSNTNTNQTAFEVELPAGGMAWLESADEQELWNSSMKRYVEDYGLRKQNDLILLGAVLTQQIIMFRAQRNLTDPKVKAGDVMNTLKKAAEEIRELEKALGIDKKTREAGGMHTVIDYVQNLKLAAHAKGVHITQRTKRYEEFVRELSWKVRLLRNGDDEDRHHHGLSEKKIVDWLEVELGDLEEFDKKWAREKGKVFIGRT